MLSPSKRTSVVTQSHIRSMTIECDRVGGINLAQGVGDVEVPLPVLRQAQRAMDEGVNAYTRYDGLPELRQAIARKMRDYNKLDPDQDSEIIVSAGSTGIFYCTCMALLDPGDEVILFEPFYQYHLSTLVTFGAVARFVATRAPDWTFKREELEAVITPRTKAIVVNTPSNPSGKVFTRTELEWIASCALNHNLFVITDEIYEYFLYDERPHISPASLPGMAGRTITISGFSKTLSITGWRIGYSISDAKWATMIGYMSDLVYVCAPAPLQAGVARGLEELSAQYYMKIGADFSIKRDTICASLKKAGLTPYVPQGSYYVLADVSRLPGTSSVEKAMNLLRKTGVAGVPGEAFFTGSGGDNLIRFSFAKSNAELGEACRRFEQLA